MNNDQCVTCKLTGNVAACRRAKCSVHESWYVQQLLSMLRSTRETLESIATRGSGRGIGAAVCVSISTLVAIARQEMDKQEKWEKRNE